MPDVPAIVRRFAPILAHKVSREWAAADHPTRIDLAGALTDVRENPGHLLRHTAASGDWKGDPPPAAVYYSACETGTHWFVLYAVYHPMDWWKRLEPTNLYDLIRDGADEHTHDMEGTLMVIRRDPEPTLDAMVTVAHRHFYLYTEPRVPTSDDRSRPWSRHSLAVQDFAEDVDGHIWIDRGADRPKLYIESRGHGIYGDHKRWGGGDLIRYYRPEDCDRPELVDPRDDVDFEWSYELIDLFEADGVWAHRYDRDVFRQARNGRWGFVGYKEVTEGDLLPSSANPPWSWNDKDDPSPIGEIATDPARFMSRYAEALGPLSQQYTANRYLGL